MKIIKQSFRVSLLLMLAIVSLAASCDKNNYPEIEDGLYAEIVTTKGTMVAKLFYDKVPVTVANFVALAEGTHPKLVDSLKGKPFYNGIIFHRVMDKFMIQGGDPTGTGMGNAGFRFMSEFDPSLSHDKAGILSMANSGGLSTNSSQFFITEVPKTNLDGFYQDGTLKNCNGQRVSCHSVFGELALGLDVQDTISNVPVTKDRATKPLEDVVINAVNIIRKGKSAKAFDAPKVFTEQEPKLGEKIEAFTEKAAELAKENAKVAADNFKKENADMAGEFYESPTGIIMINNKAANGKKPTSAQKVLVDCSAYFTNGNLLYTTIADVDKANNQYTEQKDKGGAYNAFPMIYNESATLVAGFREAMLRMNIGDKARVFVPSHLGYGASGRAPLVPPNTDLYFDIELVGIAK